ncbi:hypothetical protein BH23CHL2_BH23CHL2_15420 [soil metagenome]
MRKVKLDRLPVHFHLLAVSFRRLLAAENNAPRTVETYPGAIKVLGAFLERHGMPINPAIISHEHIEEFIAGQLRQWKPATANNRYRALQAFWKWLGDEGELEDANPFDRMSPPTVPEEPPEVLTDRQLKKLLRACAGRDSRGRRDTAIIRLLLVTGMHRDELAGLSVDDLDVEHNVPSYLASGGGRASYLWLMDGARYRPLRTDPRATP